MLRVARGPQLPVQPGFLRLYSTRSAPSDRSLKSQLHAFLKKVHPDRFHSYPLVQRVNQESLTRLNNFLDAVTMYTETGRFAEDIPRRLDFSFYFRPAPDSPFRLLKSQIVLPDSAMKSASKLGDVASRQLLKMMSLTEDPLLPAPEEDETPEEDNEEDDEWKIADLSDSADALYAAIRHPRPQPLPPSEELTVRVTRDHELRALFRPSMVFYADDLTPAERRMGLAHLRRHLSPLHFEKWSLHPVMLTRSHFASDLEGFLVMPIQFELQDALRYLEERLPQLQRERDSRIAALDHCLMAADRLQQTLRCRSVSMHALLPMQKVSQALQSLTSTSDRLRNIRKDWSRMDIIVSPKRQVEINYTFASTILFVPPTATAEEIEQAIALEEVHRAQRERDARLDYLHTYDPETNQFRLFRVEESGTIVQPDAREQKQQQQQQPQPQPLLQQQQQQQPQLLLQQQQQPPPPPPEHSWNPEAELQEDFEEVMKNEEENREAKGEQAAAAEKEMEDEEEKEQEWEEYEGNEEEYEGNEEEYEDNEEEYEGNEEEYEGYEEEYEGYDEEEEKEIAAAVAEQEPAEKTPKTDAAQQKKASQQPQYEEIDLDYYLTEDPYYLKLRYTPEQRAEINRMVEEQNQTLEEFTASHFLSERQAAELALGVYDGHYVTDLRERPPPSPFRPEEHLPLEWFRQPTRDLYGLVSKEELELVEQYLQEDMEEELDIDDDEIDFEEERRQGGVVISQSAHKFNKAPPSIQEVLGLLEQMRESSEQKGAPDDYDSYQLDEEEEEGDDEFEDDEDVDDEYEEDRHKDDKRKDKIVHDDKYDDDDYEYEDEYAEDEYGPEDKEYEDEYAEEDYGPENKEYEDEYADNEYWPEDKEYEDEYAEDKYGPEDKEYEDEYADNEYWPEDKEYEGEYAEDEYGPEGEEEEEKEDSQPPPPRRFPPPRSPPRGRF